MADKPKSVNLDISEQVRGQIRNTLTAEMQQVRDEGVEEGFEKGRQWALDILQRKYIDDDDRPDRSSPEAQAIIKLARELAQEMGRGSRG